MGTLPKIAFLGNAISYKQLLSFVFFRFSHDITEAFCQLGKKLLADFELSRTLVASTNLGQVREHFVRKFLRQNLGTNIGIAAGEIIDFSSSEQYQSRNQMDVVIYKHDFPKLDFDDAGIYMFLIESVVATIEVKSTLSKSDLCHISKVAKNLKSLKRTSVNNVDYTPYLIAPGPCPRPWPHAVLNFVVAYESDASINTIANNWLADITSDSELGLSVPPEKFEERKEQASPIIDGIFILGNGSILFDNNKIFDVPATASFSRDENHWLILTQESHNLAILFMLLTMAISHLTGGKYYSSMRADISMSKWVSSPTP